MGMLGERYSYLFETLSESWFQDVETIFVSILLSSSRFMAIFLITPIFQTSNVPQVIRGALGITLSFITYPTVHAELATTGLPENLPLIGLVLKETFTGILLALVIGLPAWAVEAAGTIIDTQRGASTGSSQSPISQNDVQPLGAFFMYLYLVWMFVSGAFTKLLGVIFNSYIIWPVLSFYPQLRAVDAIFYLDLLDLLMEWSLLMAGPIMLTMFLGEMSLIFVARFAPQLNVFTLAMPVKSGIAFMILIFYLPFLFEAMDHGFNMHIELLDMVFRDFQR